MASSATEERERVNDIWDPQVLIGFRARWGLTKSDLERLLRAHGLRKLNWSTYWTWEKGLAGGGSDPRPVYRDTIMRALGQIERQFKREGRPTVSAPAPDRRRRRS